MLVTLSAPSGPLERAVSPGSRAAPAKAGPPRLNNFDLIRLLAACQVLLLHGYEHLELAGRYPWLDRAMDLAAYFPGVPIFFTVSGFLIFWAYERTRDLKGFFISRFLRIYPGLWLSFGVTVAILAVFGYFPFAGPALWAFVLGQLTIVQVYTPAALRPYGVHNPNGSLWTISVELQFYALVPILWALFGRSRTRRNLVLALCFALSLASNLVAQQLDPNGLGYKVAIVTVFPYLFFFFFGTAVYCNWDRLGGLIAGRVGLWAAAYALYVAVIGLWLRLYDPLHQATYWPDLDTLVAHFLLSMLVLAFAFSYNALSERLVRGVDLSYGTYLYHMIVFNVLVQVGMVGKLAWLGLGWGASMMLAAFSWFGLESPIMRIKGRILKRSAGRQAVSG